MDWLVLQLADSAFPMGAFAHSFGLEASVQLGLVRGTNQVREFTVAVIKNSRHAIVPWLRRGFAADEVAALATVDAACDAFMTNAIANRASRLSGRAFVRAIESAFPDAVADFSPAAKAPCHAAPWSGALLRRLGATWESALQVQLYWLVRGVLSAAVRLGQIGPLAAQHLQRELQPILDAELVAAPIAVAASTTPIADLAQSRHDQLYSRLFQS